MSGKNVISEIRNVASTKIPKGAQVILFGSQARGDAHKDSDWDLLVLLDKDFITQEDHDLYSYPFWELGWKIDAMIHPAVYTKNDWITKDLQDFRAFEVAERIVSATSSFLYAFDGEMKINSILSGNVA